MRTPPPPRLRGPFAPAAGLLAAALVLSGCQEVQTATAPAEDAADVTTRRP